MTDRSLSIRAPGSPRVVCPNCAAQSYNRGGRHPDRLAQDRDCCLRDVPIGAQCRPDGIGPVGSKAEGRDDDFSDGCEYSHFIFGKVCPLV